MNGPASFLTFINIIFLFTFQHFGNKMFSLPQTNQALFFTLSIIIILTTLSVQLNKNRVNFTKVMNETSLIIFIILFGLSILNELSSRFDTNFSILLITAGLIYSLRSYFNDFFLTTKKFVFIHTRLAYIVITYNLLLYTFELLNVWSQTEVFIYACASLLLIECIMEMILSYRVLGLKKKNYTGEFGCLIIFYIIAIGFPYV